MSSIFIKVDEIVKKIVKYYQPEMILLFGSAAEDRFREDSDIDLLIVKQTDRPPIWRRVEVRKIVQADVPMDIIVLTPGEYMELKKSGSLFLSDILKHGKIVYEKGTE